MLKLLFALLVPLGFVGLLAAFQDRLVYFPRRYALAPTELPPPLVALAFETESGRQHAVYLPPRSGRFARLWLMFGGNAMTALDWVAWLEVHPDADAGFLLVEYPGYGWSEGRPSAASIASASAGAHAALAGHLGMPQDALDARTCAFGHSIGAGAALMFAAERKLACIVLSAPFTRLADVAAHHYGGWVRSLVRADYDNLARLAELDGLRPALHVVHGGDDEIIPVAQGRELARRYAWVKYHEIPGARHNDVLDLAQARIHGLMLALARTHAPPVGAP